MKLFQTSETSDEIIDSIIERKKYVQESHWI